MQSLINQLSLALWDNSPRRAAILKDRLDMFAPEGKKTILLPISIECHKEAFDVVFLSFNAYDETVKSAARAIRVSGESTYLVLVAAKGVDLSPLFRPAIRPCGVIFHPADVAKIRDIFDEISEEEKRITANEPEDTFVFKSLGVCRRIPFREIMFFEASNKKISIFTAGQELSYYDTIENLLSKLPKYFVRCHRSYLVNANKIKSVSLPESLLELNSGDCIPISRSGHKILKEVLI